MSFRHYCLFCLFLVSMKINLKHLLRNAPHSSTQQARAPESRCIIVGTHVDKMPYFRKTETLDKYRSDILNKFQRPGFPLISGCFFVSGKTGENIEELRQVIHEDAFKMNQESEMGKIVSL